MYPSYVSRPIDKFRPGRRAQRAIFWVRIQSVHDGYQSSSILSSPCSTTSVPTTSRGAISALISIAASTSGPDSPAIDRLERVVKECGVDYHYIVSALLIDEGPKQVLNETYGTIFSSNHSWSSRSSCSCPFDAITTSLRNRFDRCF